MSFVIIIAISISVLILFRMIILLFCSPVFKLFKLRDSNMGFNLPLSIAFFTIYLQGFLTAIKGIVGVTEITNLEWYMIYTFIGIAAILWCYFSWSFEWKAKPQFAKKDSQMIVKKIIVFSALTLFVFCQGYNQLNMNFGENLDKEKEMLFKVVNITMVPGIIALDRVLNQINNYIKKKKEK